MGELDDLDGPGEDAIDLHREVESGWVSPA